MFISTHSLSFNTCTFGSNYSVKSFWMESHKLGTPIFGKFFAAPLKLNQVRWEASMMRSHFQVSPEMFNRIPVWATGWVTEWRSQSCYVWSNSFGSFHLVTLPYRPDRCRDGCPSGRFSSLHRGALDLWLKGRWVLVHVQSSEFPTDGLKLSCRDISRLISGNKMQLSSILSLMAKAVNTFVHLIS